MTTTRVFSASFLLFVWACGGGGGGGSVGIPGDESDPFNSLSADDMMSVCQDMEAQQKMVISGNTDTVCVAFAMGQSVEDLGEDLNFDAARAKCEQSMGMCDMALDELLNQSSNCSDTVDEWSECTATIGVMSTCINEAIANVKSGMAALKGETCASIFSMEGLTKLQGMFSPTESQECDELPWECDL